jgi:serine/threonine protein kinase
LFPGDSEIDELFRIFRCGFFGLRGRISSADHQITSVLGTPKEETWKGVSQLPDYKETFPTWSAQNLSTLVKNLDANGVDLLQVSSDSNISLSLPQANVLFCQQKMLAYDPAQRISAKRALQHPYFADLPASPS